MWLQQYGSLFRLHTGGTRKVKDTKRLKLNIRGWLEVMVYCALIDKKLKKLSIPEITKWVKSSGYVEEIAKLLEKE